MKISNRQIVSLAISTCIAFSTAGCSSTPSDTAKQDPASSLSNESKYQSDIFAKLEKHGNGYQFTEFQVNEVPTKGAWVNLRTGEPTWSTQDSRCGEGIVKDRMIEVPSCSDVVDESLFMVTDFDEGDVLTRTLLAPLTFGTSLTGVSFDIHFDRDAFNRAMVSAYQSTDEAQLQQIDIAVTDWLASYRSLTSSYKNSIQEWRDGVQLKVSDKSGFYKGDPANDFTRYLYITPSHFTPPKAIVADSSHQLLANVKAEKQAHLQKVNHSTSIIGLTCKDTNQKGFNIHYQCPEYLDVNTKKQEVTGDIGIQILSKDIDDVTPPRMIVKNNEISVHLDSGEINLVSSSTDFITVESISFYYNGLISTRKDLNLELAPESRMLPSNKLSLKRDFTIDWSALSFKNLTNQQANNIKLKYGFAVKYRRNSEENTKTLFERNQYKLSDISI